MLEFVPLRGVCHAEVAVVGGGWTGLLAACGMAQQGLQVHVITANATPPPPVMTLHAPERFARIAACHGAEVLRDHVALMRQAMQSPLPVPSMETEVYTAARMQEELPGLDAQLACLVDAGVTSNYAPDAGGCPFPVLRSIRTAGLLTDAHKLQTALVQEILKNGGRVHRDRAMNANARQVFTPTGRIDAAQVVLCTGIPMGLTGGLLTGLFECRAALFCQLDAPVPLHTVQHTTEGALQLLPDANGVMALMDTGRTGSRQGEADAARCRRFLRRFMPEWPSRTMHFRPHVRTADGLPVVGRFRTAEGGILFAGGAGDFLSARLAARTLVRLTLHVPHEQDLLLRPDRQLPASLLHRGRLTARKGRALAALRRGAPRCSHCACRLRWHAAARWWGCAFCGSCFTLLGHRLSVPALADAAISARQRPGW